MSCASDISANGNFDPFGGFDEQIIERTRQAGYLTALTCDDGNVNRHADPLKLNRRLVFRTTTLRQFAAYVQDGVLEVGDLEPRDGERVAEPPLVLRGRILAPSPSTYLFSG